MLEHMRGDGAPAAASAREDALVLTPTPETPFTHKPTYTARETRNPKPETRDPKPETRNLKP